MRCKKLLRLLMTGALLTGLSGCVFLPTEEEQIRPPLLVQSTSTYQTEEVQFQTVQTTRTMSAYSEYKNSYMANTGESTGNFEILDVRVGQQVKEGDLLYKMAENEYEVQRDEYYEAYLEARQNYEQAQGIYAEGSTELEIARAQMQRYLSMYNQFETACANKQAYAPFDGTVIWVNPDYSVGSSCSKWQDVVQVIQNDEMVLRYNGTGYNLLEEGNVYTAAYRDSNGNVTYHDVEVIYNEGAYKPVTAGTVSYDVELQFVDPEMSIMEGRYVDIEVVLETHENAITVPPTAINTVNGTTYIKLLREDEVIEVYVTTGFRTTQYVEITEPSIEILEGDLVIVQ